MKKSTLILSPIIALLALGLWAPMAGAYPTYSAGEIEHPPGSPRCRATDTEGCEESFGNCNTCHGHFRATDETNSRPSLRDQYFDQTDGKTWEVVYQEVSNDEPELEVGLHDVHRHVMLDKEGRSRCDTCHFGPSRFPVFLSLSNGGGGVLDPVSCMGCHGRYEDAGHDSISGGLGAGLRQHHTRVGVTECKTCHLDADPANYTPVGEDVMPPYYSAPNDVFINKPTDPCNQHGEEDYVGTRRALDNDGDGRYDRSDQDCKKK